jgi:hypothetical protein
MEHKTAFVLIVIAGIFAISVRCRADSDGYFCSSEGYLAYEVRQGITPGVVGHKLKIVRFDSQSGIRNAGEVVLSDFQVHVMTCDVEYVEMAGYGTALPGSGPPLTTCVIDIADLRSSHGGPRCTQDTGLHYSRTEGPEPPNLGQWAREKLITLPSPDPGQNYYLKLQRSTKKVGEYGWETHFKTELIQADKQANVVRRFVVYDARIVASGSDD